MPTISEKSLTAGARSSSPGEGTPRGSSELAGQKLLQSLLPASTRSVCSTGCIHKQDDPLNFQTSFPLHWAWSNRGITASSIRSPSARLHELAACHKAKVLSAWIKQQQLHSQGGSLQSNRPKRAAKLVPTHLSQQHSRYLNTQLYLTQALPALGFEVQLCEMLRGY